MKRLLFILITTITVFGSCKKEDVTPPVINSLNIEVNDTLSNKFILKVDATDNKSISKVEYYANDSLFAEINQTPFDFEWNTLLMKDGNYTIKVVVFDPEGNKTESSTNVVIQNVLLSLKMGNLYSIKYYIVVSDEKGNILNSTTFVSNDIKKIMPLSVFEDKAINIVYYYTAFGYTYILGYIHVKRGSEFKMGSTGVSPALKDIKLHLKNDIGSFLKVRVSTDQSYKELATLADTNTYPEPVHYTANHRLLLQLQTNSGGFYKFMTIENIENLSVNLSSIDIPETAKSYSLPVGSYFYAFYGRENEGNTSNDYFLGLGNSLYNDTHMEIYYPAEYFTQFRTLLLYYGNGDGRSYSNMYVGELPASFTPATGTALVTSKTPANFKAELTGTFDFYETYFYNQTISLHVSIPFSQKEWILPDLATAFGSNDFNLTNFKLTQITMQDYESLDWTNKYYDLNEDFVQLGRVDKLQKSIIVSITP